MRPDKCTTPDPSFVPMDINIYATRKTVAQAMMDIALLTANASQLKYVLNHSEIHDYFVVNVVLIGSSIFLQVIVGILLILVGRSNINQRKHQRKAEDLNNAVVILIFLITVINVIISAFGVDIEDFEFDHVPVNSTGAPHDKVKEM